MTPYWMRNTWQPPQRHKLRPTSSKPSLVSGLNLGRLLLALVASVACLIVAVLFTATLFTSKLKKQEPMPQTTKPIPMNNCVPTVLRYIWSGPTTSPMWLIA